MHCQKPKRQTECEAPLSDGAEEGAVTERPAALAAHAGAAGNIGKELPSSRGKHREVLSSVYSQTGTNCTKS